jgi:DNA-binding PadR family transcriptional regulator
VSAVSTTHVLLGLLAGGARHGYELKRDHDHRLPRARALAFGQVYATLNRMLRDGLVAAAAEQARGPERTAYTLTPYGRQELDRWIATVEDPAPYVSAALFTKVMVAVLAADEDAARRYLTAQRAAHTARLRELTSAKTDPSAGVGDIVAADFAIGHLDADLRWMATTLARVGELRREAQA